MSWLQAIQAAQLVLYIGLLAQLGQGLLYLLTGDQRRSNLIYQLFQVLNKPWMALARGLTGPWVAEGRRHWVAFGLTALLYLGVTLARIAHCLDIGIQACL